MPKFGELEEQVMMRLWAANRPLLVREVRQALLPERDLAHTTVMTVLDKLYRKGWLRRETSGRAYAYSPVMSRESYTATLMHEAWAAAENPAAALVYFFETMTSDQLAALRDALRIVPLPPARRGGPHPTDDAPRDHAGTRHRISHRRSSRPAGDGTDRRTLGSPADH
jgi:predicted transcriptional regulator